MSHPRAVIADDEPLMRAQPREAWLSTSRCATGCRRRVTDHGEHQVKNISRPVRIFLIEP